MKRDPDPDQIRSGGEQPMASAAASEMEILLADRLGATAQKGIDLACQAHLRRIRVANF
jgi:hypothetical protein